METKIYNQKGKESGTLTLPEEVFGLSWNADLVHQVVSSMVTSARTPVAHTKTRGEVRGGGKKPWKQKGTGRARHGSTRSPIWVGGGVAHGPRNDKNFDRKVNKKMKTKALFTILSKKLKDGEVIFIDSIKMTASKTKEAKSIISDISTVKGFGSLATKKKNAAYIAVSEKNKEVERSFQNFGNIEVSEVRNMNPLQALQYKYLIISGGQDAVENISSRLARAK